MSKIVFICICAIVLTAGCNKNKQVAAHSETTGESSMMSRSSEIKSVVSKSEKAEGDMKAILLTLKRVHFSYDGSALTEGSKTALQEAAEKLREYPEVRLFVDGHTDERGTTEYNMSLGDRRALAVVSYLKNCGVEPERLETVSFGEESPMDNGSDSLAFARNRRVDFRLIAGDVEFVLEEGDLMDDEGAPMQNAGIRPAATENHAG